MPNTTTAVAPLRFIGMKSPACLCIVVLVLFLTACRSGAPDDQMLDLEFSSFDLVYSLAPPGSPQSDIINATIEANVQNGLYRSAIPAGQFEGFITGRRYHLLGTVDNNPVIVQQLAALGISKTLSGVKIGERQLWVNDWCIMALYDFEGSEILLATAHNYNNLLNVKMEYPISNSYSLLDQSAMVLEYGKINRAGNAFALRPQPAPLESELWPELASALLQVIQYPDVEDFSFIDALADSNIVFIGEQHNQPAVEVASIGIIKRLVEKHTYNTYATEHPASIAPFYENASVPGAVALPGILATPDTDFDYFGNSIIQAIFTMNATLPENRRVLVTAVDIDHVINHSKEHTIRYWSWFGTKLQSATGRTALAAQLPKLAAAHTLQDIEFWLDGLEEIFNEYSDFLTEADFKEVQYMLALERASANYQLLEATSGGQVRRQLQFEEQRGSFFRASIERAWQKAKERGGKLICQVGGAHAVLNQFDDNDYPVGRISEARYFDTEFSETAGRVSAIAVYTMALSRTDPLVRLAMQFAPDSKHILIDLDAIQHAMVDRHIPGRFFTDGRQAKFKYLLLVAP